MFVIVEYLKVAIEKTSYYCNLLIKVHVILGIPRLHVYS